ncbi:MAG: hypothetical protein WC307_00190 [Candidatus Nanoarchaeia archaeon]|jgi:hypothetical protein
MDLLKEFKKEKESEMLRLLLLKWLCDQNAWAAKYMHELSCLFNKEFTTSSLAFKSSRAYELIKEWESKGLIKVTDYVSKSRKYAYTPTLFAKTIEAQQISEEKKHELLDQLDDLFKIKK